MNLETFLVAQDERYDPRARMPWRLSRSNGYHTRIPAGTRVHETRESTDYALALLQAGRVDRAREVLGAIVDAQVTDPLDEHYGIWGYFLEEPPAAMGPADWNWADFIGVRLAQVLAVHGDVLDGRLAEALRHAARSIFRRNVGPRYTNIALLGAVVAAAAGELLDEPFLLDYARRRLAALAALGSFAEYNSPAYSPFLLEIAERAALIVRDPEVLAMTERLRVRVWEALAERFHPGTGQLAGPHARAYADWLRPGLVDYLAAQTGAPIQVRPGVVDGDDTPRLFPSLPCPPSVATRFRALDADPVEVVTTFDEGVVGTTWLTEDACLGSVNEEFAWTQRRPLLGYWRTSEDPAVVLRARMLSNGHDLSAAWCRQVQSGARVLSGWWLSYDSGDFHPNLDRPVDSIFEIESLVLRVSLRGIGVSGKALGDGDFSLSAGDWSAVVHTAPASFLGERAEWALVEEGDEVAAEVVLHRGDRRAVDFHTAILRAAFAVELRRSGAGPDEAAPVEAGLVGAGPVEAAPVGAGSVGAGSVGVGVGALAGVVEEEGFRWSWGDLAVTSPDRPTRFPR